MTGCGTVTGMKSLIEEFDSEMVGISVFAESDFEGNRMVDDYTSILKVDKVDIENKTLSVSYGNYLTKNADRLA